MGGVAAAVAAIQGKVRTRLMRRFFAPASSVRNGTVTLGEDETRHMRDVLRLRVGDEVYVIDGEGREMRCRIDTIEKKGAGLTIIEAVAPTAAESPLDLTLAVAILKGDKFELVIQKAVELGITRLVPLETERSDVKVKDLARKLGRWKRVILEASKQSGRAKLMEIREPQSIADLLLGADPTVIVFTESGGGRFPERLEGKPLTTVVGPAGGWSAAELDLARSVNAILVTLGGRILRAETAAITAAALLQHRFGDLN